MAYGHGTRNRGVGYNGRTGAPINIGKGRRVVGGRRTTPRRNSRRVHSHAYSGDVRRHWGRYPSVNPQTDFVPGHSGGYYHGPHAGGEYGAPGAPMHIQNPNQRHFHGFHPRTRSHQHRNMQHSTPQYEGTQRYSHHHIGHRGRGNSSGTIRNISGRFKKTM